MNWLVLTVKVLFFRLLEHQVGPLDVSPPNAWSTSPSAVVQCLVLSNIKFLTVQGAACRYANSEPASSTIAKAESECTGHVNR